MDYGLILVIRVKSNDKALWELKPLYIESGLEEFLLRGGGGGACDWSTCVSQHLCHINASEPT
jgi:hypothetical protein